MILNKDPIFNEIVGNNVNIIARFVNIVSNL